MTESFNLPTGVHQEAHNKREELASLKTINLGDIVIAVSDGNPEDEKKKYELSEETRTKIKKLLYQMFDLQEKELAETKRFSPEAREALEKNDFMLLNLDTPSHEFISSLLMHRSDFYYDKSDPYSLFYDEKGWTKRYGYRDSTVQPPKYGEVAIDIKQFYLPDSVDKVFIEQREMAENYSQSLGHKIPDVKAVIGDATDYLSLAYVLSSKNIPENPFNKLAYGFRTLTRSPGGSFVSFKTYIRMPGGSYRPPLPPAKALEIFLCGEEKLHDVAVAPLIVPA